MSYALVRSTVGHATGRRYFEIEVLAYEGIGSGRWAQAGITRSVPNARDAFSYPGSAEGAAIVFDGYPNVENAVGDTQALSPPVGAGDVLGFAVDFAADPANVRVYVSLNGSFQGADPFAGTGSITPLQGVLPLPPGTYHASCSYVGPGQSGVVSAFATRLHAKAAQMKHQIPEGYAAWET